MNQPIIPSVLAAIGIWLFPVSASAQQVFSSQSDSKSINNLTLSWTIGEPFTSQGSTECTMVTEGFQQPLISISEFIQETATLQEFIEVSVFPNPVQNEVFIELHDASVAGLTGTLRNAEGKALQSFVLSSTHRYVLDMSSRSPGIFLLTLSEEGSLNQKTYQIVKSH